MAKVDFYHIAPPEKEAIFTEIATQLGMKPFAVEKDWWVSRTLETTLRCWVRIGPQNPIAFITLRVGQRRTFALASMS